MAISIASICGRNGDTPDRGAELKQLCVAVVMDELEVAKNEDIGLMHAEGPAVRHLKRWAYLEQGNTEVPQGITLLTVNRTQIIFFLLKLATGTSATC